MNTIDFSYKGTVKIQIKSKKHNLSPYYFSNNGKKAFFDTITRALCGENVVDELPYYLDVYTYDSNGNVIGSLLRHPLTFSGTVWGAPAGATSDNGCVLYKTLITKDDLGYINAANNTEIVLLSRTKEILCGVTDNELKWMSEITDSADALVLWTLQFSNE